MGTAEIKQIACGSDKVGDVVLLGRFGGAYCAAYEIVRFEEDRGLRKAVLVPAK